MLLSSRTFGSFALATSILATTHLVHADTYPDRPVTVVVPYSAGGPTDVLGRLLTAALSDMLGQSFLVENRPGAATQVGATYVSTAPNDGYTLLIANTTTLSLNPNLHSDLSYSVAAFEPVALVAKIPIGFAVRADLPADSIDEFRHFVAESGEELTYGSAGTGSNSQMVTALMNRELGIEMLEIPYQGTAPALVDLVAGHVDGLVDAMGTLAPMHLDGRIKILGNFDTERNSAVPDVPTFIEQGVDIAAFTWNAVVVPAGTSPEIVATLNDALGRIVNDPGFAERLAAVGFVPMFSTQDELSSYIVSETERWRNLIDEMGLNPN
jgi:tripartite-type tricarboxylate transporter receptor subunit TctC